MSTGESLLRINDGPLEGTTRNERPFYQSAPRSSGIYLPTRFTAEKIPQLIKFPGQYFILHLEGAPLQNL
jgi:hypothetical protein